MTENQLSVSFMLVVVMVGVFLTVWVMHDRDVYRQHCHDAGGLALNVNTKQRLCVSPEGRILPV